MGSRRALVAVVALALTGTAAGCGGARPTSGDAVHASVKAGRGLVPSDILGLRVEPENIDRLLKKAGRDTYVTSVRLWSLRDGDRLRATLEVARLAPDARPEDEHFRTAIANVGRAGTVRWIDRREVYVRAANQQSIYVWFSGIDFLMLSVSGEYPAPRALLRAALAVKP